MVCVDKDEQRIIIEFTKINGEIFVVTMVHASTDIILRRDLWIALIAIEARIRVPLIVLGDFNSIQNSHERVGGVEVRPQHFTNFFGLCQYHGVSCYEV